jgi:DNA-directed RNA polymerase specialized sigma24 family protein
MSTIDEKQFKEITSKMDLIVRLLALNIVKDLKVQKDKIITLSSFGFGPSEIARLLGTTPHTVSVTLSDVKKKAKKEEKLTEATQTGSKVGQDIDTKKVGETIA